MLKCVFLVGLVVVMASHFEYVQAERDCIVGGRESLVGKTLIEKDVISFKAVNPETEVFEESLPVHRLFHPGQLGMTADYNARRANVYLDEKNVITLVTCG